MELRKGRRKRKVVEKYMAVKWLCPPGSIDSLFIVTVCADKWSVCSGNMWRVVPRSFIKWFVFFFGMGFWYVERKVKCKSCFSEGLTLKFVKFKRFIEIRNHHMLKIIWHFNTLWILYELRVICWSTLLFMKKSMKMSNGLIYLESFCTS